MSSSKFESVEKKNFSPESNPPTKLFTSSGDSGSFIALYFNQY